MKKYLTLLLACLFVFGCKQAPENRPQPENRGGEQLANTQCDRTVFQVRGPGFAPKVGACVPANQCARTKFLEAFCLETTDARCGERDSDCTNIRRCRARFDEESEVVVANCVSRVDAKICPKAGEVLCECDITVPENKRFNCKCGCRSAS